MFKRGLFVALILALGFILVNSSRPVQAQVAEPTALIDAAFKDLSGRVGKTLNRGNVTNWTWEGDIFNDTSLDCPIAGQSYAQVKTAGFKILITYGGTVYDYRANQATQGLFLCVNGSPAGSGGSVQQPTAIPAQATAIPGQPTTIPTTFTAPTSVPPAQSQPVSYQNPVAYINNDGNVYITSLGTQPGTPLTKDAQKPVQPAGMVYPALDHYYQLPRWSPDGTKLLFMDGSTNTLLLATSGNAPTVIAHNTAGGFPATWFPDNNTVAYVVNTNPAAAPGNSLALQIQQISAAGGQPRIMATIKVQSDCAGGEDDPSGGMYSREAGMGGNHPFFFWTPKGWLYATSCSGIGLALNGFDGNLVWKNDTLGRIAVSPDGTHAAGVVLPQVQETGTLETIDLSNGSITNVDAQPGVSQVAWSADGSTLFYSTLTDKKDLKSTRATQGQPVAGTAYTVSLWKVSATGGTSAQLFTTSARAIGIIAPSRDNQTVIFSEIPSVQAMVDLDSQGKSSSEVTAAAPKIQLLSVSVNATANASAPLPTVAPGGQPATALGTFAALPAGAQAQSTGGIPGMAVGVHAIVVVSAGDTLNLRQSPSTTAAVLRLLKPGVGVKILAGPQTTSDGLHWWQVRVDDDNSIGWVVDQVPGPNGMEDTLAVG